MKFSEKLEDKALDVGGKIAEEGAKQVLGIGGALGLLIKLGAIGGFILLLGIVGLAIFLLVKFFT